MGSQPNFPGTSGIFGLTSPRAITGCHLFFYLSRKLTGDPFPTRPKCGQSRTMPISCVPANTIRTVCSPGPGHQCLTNSRKPLPRMVTAVSSAALSSPVPPCHFWKEDMGTGQGSYGQTGREFLAGASWLQSTGGFLGKVTQPQELETAASMPGWWCWRPRMGLPSGAKEGQHCSA